MPSAVSRRALLGAGLALLGGTVVGCTARVSGTAGSAAASATGSASPSPSTTGSTRPTVRSSPADPSSSVLPPSTAATTASSSVPGAPAVEIGTGPAGKPVVALTFHGGGDPATASSILDICAARGAGITVLAIGTWLQANPVMARAIVGGGHDLGNHTWSHQVLSDLDEAAVRDEITRCRDLLVQLTGSPGPFFRTSSGQHATPLIRQEAGRAGYPVCLSYDVDPEDWTDPGATAVRAGTQSAVAGSIVSLHFGHPGTVDALPSILDDLQARGLQAVTASALLAP